MSDIKINEFFAIPQLEKKQPVRLEDFSKQFIEKLDSYENFNCENMNKNVAKFVFLQLTQDVFSTALNFFTLSNPENQERDECMGRSITVNLKKGEQVACFEILCLNEKANQAELEKVSEVFNDLVCVELKLCDFIKLVLDQNPPLAESLEFNVDILSKMFWKK